MERIDPEISVDERTTLSQYLDFQRATILRKAEGLTAEQLAMKTAASDLTLAGLLKHLALVEDHWFRYMFLGEEREEIWRDIDWDTDPNWEFNTAVEDDPEYLFDLYQAACDRSRRIVANAPSLGTPSVRKSQRRDGEPSLRWVMLHMLEETARHNGHADFLREAIDGSVGE